MDIVTTLVAVALTAAVVIPLIVVVVLVRQLVVIARSTRPRGERQNEDEATDGDD